LPPTCGRPAAPPGNAACPDAIASARAASQRRSRRTSTLRQVLAVRASQVGLRFVQPDLRLLVRLRPGRESDSRPSRGAKTSGFGRPPHGAARDPNCKVRDSAWLELRPLAGPEHHFPCSPLFCHASPSPFRDFSPRTTSDCLALPLPHRPSASAWADCCFACHLARQSPAHYGGRRAPSRARIRSSASGFTRAP